MVRGLLINLALLASCRIACCAEPSQDPEPDSLLPAERIVAGLPWRFNVSAEQRPTTSHSPHGSPLKQDFGEVPSRGTRAKEKGSVRRPAPPSVYPNQAGPRGQAACTGIWSPVRVTRLFSSRYTRVGLNPASSDWSSPA